MPTNEERREVAARLRNYENLRESLGESPICAFLDALGVGYLDWKGVCNRLADLIEPEPERTTRLELLATEVDENGDALAVGVHCALCGLLDEEVVGADPDNWMLWRYCPSCGAKVIANEMRKNG